MYEHEGLNDILFLMLYGGAALLAVVACLYLLFSRGNVMSSKVTPPVSLRRWAAAFMASVAASHVWWVVLGIYWLTDDRFMRDVIAVTLDRLTLFPLMMIVLIRMLQDRKRPLWPVAVAMIPFVVVAVIRIVNHDGSFGWFNNDYTIVIATTFIIYYLYALRQYGRWLHDNYADLQHKEVWQSLVLLAVILFVYLGYTNNEGALATEYFAQINTLIIIGFILWRVETLQQLDDEATQQLQEDEETEKKLNIRDNIGALLEQRCEATQLYLKQDITLVELALTLGTNRTYLSTYFAQQGIAYNTYINNLRIEHFMRLYREMMSVKGNADQQQASEKRPSVLELSEQSGFSSYSTFAINFKRFTGISVTTWIKQQDF